MKMPKYKSNAALVLFCPFVCSYRIVFQLIDATPRSADQAYFCTEEPPTPLEMTMAAQPTIAEDRLFSHPVFLHYHSLRNSHLANNSLNAAIAENIHPNLTGNVLAGEDKIAARSETLFVIDDKFLSVFDDFELVDSSENNHSYTFFHLGDQLSGHPTIVHGGLIATLLDEITCRLGFQSYQSKRGVTANLNINYYQPCRTNSYIMIKCSVIRKIGRKCWVKGEVYRLNSENTDFCDPQEVETKQNLISGCECLIVEPKWQF